MVGKKKKKNNNRKCFKNINKEKNKRQKKLHGL